MAVNRRVSTFLPPLNLSFQLPLVNHSKGLLLQVSAALTGHFKLETSYCPALQFFFQTYFLVFFTYKYITLHELSACLQDLFKCFPYCWELIFLFLCSVFSLDN